MIWIRAGSAFHSVFFKVGMVLVIGIVKYRDIGIFLIYTKSINLNIDFIVIGHNKKYLCFWLVFIPNY